MGVDVDAVVEFPRYSRPVRDSGELRFTVRVTWSEAAQRATVTPT